MTEPSRRGFCLIIAGPSGCGKTAMMDCLLAMEDGLVPSVSATTRAQRYGEVDGRHYHFKTQAEFEDLVHSGGMLEHATVFGRSYGIPQGPVVSALEHGIDVVFVIDWQGHRTLSSKLPGDVLSVFLMPPSLQALEGRLRARGDNPEAIAQRMGAAAAEMSHASEFDHVVVNDKLGVAIAEVRTLIQRRRDGIAQTSLVLPTDPGFADALASMTADTIFPLASVKGGIHDFLELDNTNNILRRSDLAALRQVTRSAPMGALTEAIHIDALDRLLLSGLAAPTLAINSFGVIKCRWLPTQDGLEAVRANTSCRDGSEGLPLTPGARRACHQAPVRIVGKRRLPVSQDPDYQAALAAAMGDTLPPAAFGIPDPVVTIRGSFDRKMGFGEAVVQWIRRQWVFGRLMMGMR